MLPLAPHVCLLEAAKATGATVDWLTDTGFAAVQVRHARNRYATDEERPCVSIDMVGDGPRDDSDHCMGETIRELTLSLTGDIELSSDDDDGAGGLDPTGLADLSRILMAFTRALRDDASPLRQLCDWVTAPEIDPDERATGQEGRLAFQVTVLYRVRTDDPNELLTPGGNA